MINNNEQPNIKLTDEQVLAIEESQRRLASIETQITVQNKNLRIAKTDTENLTKDRFLLEEEVKKLNTQIEPLKKEIGSLSEQKYDLITDLSLARSELSEVRASSDRQMTEISEQVKVHEAKEAELIIRETSLVKKEEDHRAASSELQEKISKINEAING